MTMRLVTELMSADDGSNDDNTEEIGDLENNSDVCEIHVPELKDRENKFVNIDFDSLPPQEQNVFHYFDAKGTFLWTGTLIKKI